MRLYRCNRIKTKRKERGVGQRRTGEAKFRVLRGVTTASSKTCSWPHDGPHSRAMENTRILCRVGRRPVPPPRTLPPLLRYYYTRGLISRGEMFLLQERIRCRSLAILAARFLLNFFPPRLIFSVHFNRFYLAHGYRRPSFDQHVDTHANWRRLSAIIVH